jgi:hypothetical protein
MRRCANDQEPPLGCGVVDIRKRGRDQIVEHRGGFSEIDVMVLEIGRSLRGIPAKHHGASIAVSIENLPETLTGVACPDGVDRGDFVADAGPQADQVDCSAS